MAESVEELTPLKKKLDDFGAFLSKARACRLPSLIMHVYIACPSLVLLAKLPCKTCHPLSGKRGADDDVACSPHVRR